MQDRAVDSCPFDPVPATLEPARWVRPDIVIQVRFTEWTRENVLRHPVFLGVRDDIDPRDVRREPASSASKVVASKSGGTRVEAGSTEASGRRGPKRAAAGRPHGAGSPRWPELDAETADVVAQLERLEAARRDGTLTLPGGLKLEVSNLHKVFWPAHQITKGDLLRHYVRVSPALLPVVADRPLIMKRYPNGVTGKSFYQQRAPDDPPAAVRAEHVEG